MSLALALLLLLGVNAIGRVGTAGAHFIYSCPGYAYNLSTGAHTLPSSQGCNANPQTNPGVHQWAAEQAKIILFYDGFVRYAALLQSSIRIGGTGEGRRHVNLLIDGVIAADTLLNGCTAYGASVGWPIGDHMLNPYRHFGILSYYLYPGQLGWFGWRYPERSRLCPNAPWVRTNSARMADEFFARAQREWRAFHPGDAMFNLGIALHMVQDATVPSHVHPERKTQDHFPAVPGVPLDSYPAWANANRVWNGVNSGGLYTLPTSSNGVTIEPTAGGWVYWMASIAYPYFYWDQTSALPLSRMRCNVTQSPEACPAEAQGLLRLTQRGSAGFIRYFFASVGYPAT